MHSSPAYRANIRKRHNSLTSSPQLAASFISSGKRDGATSGDFIQDPRQRVIGAPEISTDGLHYYRPAIRDPFGKGATHGVINKTYSVNRGR
jgi:hypothetical protein